MAMLMTAPETRDAIRAAKDIMEKFELGYGKLNAELDVLSSKLDPMVGSQEPQDGDEPTGSSLAEAQELVARASIARENLEKTTARCAQLRESIKSWHAACAKELDRRPTDFSDLDLTIPPEAATLIFKAALQVATRPDFKIEGSLKPLVANFIASYSGSNPDATPVPKPSAQATAPFGFRAVSEVPGGMGRVASHKIRNLQKALLRSKSTSSEKTEEVVAVTSELKAAKLEILRLEMALKDSAEKVSNSNDTANKLRDTIEANEETILRLHEVIAEQPNLEEVTNSRERIKQLETELGGLCQAADEHQDTLNKLNSANSLVNQQKNQIQVLERKNEQLSKHNDILTENNNALTTLIEEQKETIERKSNELDSLRDTVDQLQTGIRVSQEDPEALPATPKKMEPRPDDARNMGHLDPVSTLLVLPSIKISPADLAARCGLGVAQATRIIRVLSDIELGQLAQPPPSPAYNAQMGTTVLRMIDMFPAQSHNDMPFDWARTTRKMVFEFIRRLTVMGLVERSQGEHGVTLTAKGRTVLHLLPLLHHHIHAASLAAGAIVDTDLPNTAKRVIVRLAAVASVQGLAYKVSETAEETDADNLLANIRQSSWGPGQRFCALGGIWTELGLWDMARLRSANFQRLVEDESILSPVGGTVALRREACQEVLQNVRLLEEMLGFEQTDELEAYELGRTAFYRVQVHLATSFFERLCQVETRPDRLMPYHLIGNVCLQEETTSSLVSLDVSIKGLQELPVMKDQALVFFFYRGIMKGSDEGKCNFWDATVLPSIVLRHFHKRKMFEGSVTAGFRSLAL